jgi:hypothetical protein
MWVESAKWRREGVTGLRLYAASRRAYTSSLDDKDADGGDAPLLTRSFFLGGVVWAHISDRSGSVCAHISKRFAGVVCAHMSRRGGSVCTHISCRLAAYVCAHVSERSGGGAVCAPVSTKSVAVLVRRLDVWEEDAASKPGVPAPAVCVTRTTVHTDAVAA